MFKLVKTAALLLLFFPLASCSNSNLCSTNNNFRIDFYSGGGFTGMESGITISCEGWAKFWKRKPNSIKETTDSVSVSNDSMKKISELMKNPELFTYNNKYTGNYTIHLVLMKDIQINSISFNQSEPPENFPESMKELISEIKNIKSDNK